MDEKREILLRELHHFEAAADAASQGRLRPHTAAAANVANEFVTRTRLRDKRGRERRHLASPVAQRLMTPLVSGMAGLLIADSYLDGPAVLVVGALGALLGVGLDYRLTRSLKRAMRDRTGRCLSCDYPLRDLPDATLSDVIGISVGPRRCPECGLPWPRIPGPNG